MKPLKITTVVLGFGLTVASVLYVGYRYRVAHSKSSVPEPDLPLSTPMPVVAALGRLEPQDEVIDLAPQMSGTSLQVQALEVQVGDRVTAEEIIAILGNNTSRQAALKEAQQNVEMAQAKLEQVKTGAKVGDIKAAEAKTARLKAELNGKISAQKARIARLTAELINALAEYQRYEELYAEGAISISQLERLQTIFTTFQEQVREAETVLAQIQSAGVQEIREAEAQLEQIQEVRPIDITLAEKEVESAIATLERVEVDLELTFVRSPLEGQVLQIYTQPGEAVREQGIVALGRTGQMYAIAEVYETDIHRVRVGQTATVSSEYGGFEGTLQGMVESIGLRVHRSSLTDFDPSAPADTRVVEVKIRLNPDDSERVKTLTDLQVRVFINSGEVN